MQSSNKGRQAQSKKPGVKLSNKYPFLLLFTPIEFNSYKRFIPRSTRSIPFCVGTILAKRIVKGWSEEENTKGLRSRLMDSKGRL